MTIKSPDHPHDEPPISKVASSAQALDLSVLEQITGDSVEMLRELLGDFADMSKKLVADMVAGVDRGDVKAIMRAAHTLKGSSGLIGAQALRFKCEALEKAAAQQGIDAARAALPAVEQTHAATMLLIEAAMLRAA